MRNSLVLLSVDQPFLPPGTHMDRETWGREEERPGPSQGLGLVPWLCWRMCRASTEVIWGCSRALEECVSVLIRSSWRNSAPLEERVVLGHVLVFRGENSGAAPL